MGFMDYFYRGVEFEDVNEPEGGKPVRKPAREQNPQQDSQQEQYVTKTAPLSYDETAKRATSLAEVLVYAPHGYEDVEGLIDYLKNGSPVIVDLNSVKDNAAQRILDFLSGAIYALDGSVLRLKGGLYLFTPGGVNISA